MPVEDGFQKHPENINRNGRPKKGNTWADVIREAVGEEIEFQGTKRQYKKLIAEVLRKKALKGDLKAIEMLIERMDGKPLQTNLNTDTVKIELADPEEKNV